MGTRFTADFWNGYLMHATIMEKYFLEVKKKIFYFLPGQNEHHPEHGPRREIGDFDRQVELFSQACNKAVEENKEEVGQE